MQFEKETDTETQGSSVRALTVQTGVQTTSLVQVALHPLSLHRKRSIYYGHAAIWQHAFSMPRQRGPNPGAMQHVPQV